MSHYAITARGIGKQYQIGGAATYRTFRESLMDTIGAPLRRLRGALRGQAATELRQPFWALRDVSFEVQAGEVVGIIGRNGAGKSTLLKILSRITEPTTGEARFRGRLGSLLEVGTGFHQELTGRENIYLNGSILGMTRREITARFDEIVEFSGVESFLDTPVKHYSSGMYVRLAFAVAAHLEPEILVIDEVLSVGDAAFQKKSIGKMGEVAKSGRTVLFVSHNMAAVENLCTRGIVLQGGQVQFDGTQTDAIRHYMAGLDALRQTVSVAARTDRRGSGAVRYTGLTLRDLGGHPIEYVSSGQTFDVCLDFEAQPGLDNAKLNIGMNVLTDLGGRAFSVSNRVMAYDIVGIPPHGTIICRIERLPLPAGSYRLTINAKVNDTYADYLEDAAGLQVLEGDFFGTGRVYQAHEGVCLVDSRWSMIERGAGG